MLTITLTTAGLLKKLVNLQPVSPWAGSLANQKMCNDFGRQFEVGRHFHIIKIATYGLVKNNTVTNQTTY